MSYNWQVVTLEGNAPTSIKKKLDASSIWSRYGMGAILILVLCGVLSGGFLFYTRTRSQQVSAKLRNEIEFKIKNFIEENFKKKVSLEDFCKQYGLTLRQVQRWIKNDLNTTFNDLLTKQRMAEAKKMLEMTSKTISEICFELSYNDTSYFTKVFKGVYGTAPSDIRRSNKS